MSSGFFRVAERGGVDEPLIAAMARANRATVEWVTSPPP